MLWVLQQAVFEKSALSLQISLLKSSGAIILAKTNMAEWAFSPEISIGSVFGVIRNPYDLDRSTGGSSGGTAAGESHEIVWLGLLQS